MTTNIIELLDMPTQARSRKEVKLLDAIDSDRDLKEKGLRHRVLNYLRANNFSLVFWYHYNGIRRSFEDTEIAQDTKESYKKKSPSLPKIIGIRQHTDYD